MKADATAVGLDFNICGVLVRARPEAALAVHDRLAALPGVEVYHRTEDGRLIVTIEDTPQRKAGDTLADVHRMDGVLAASLVYHHADPSDAEPPAEERDS